MADPQPVDFSRALLALKAGRSCRRLDWHRPRFVCLRQPSDSLGYFEMVMSDGQRAPWTPSRCDLFGEDWIEVTNG
jgi:Protein of unknown function (DUF2829)